MSGDEQSAGKCNGVGQGGGKFGEPLRYVRDGDWVNLVGIGGHAECVLDSVHDDAAHLDAFMNRIASCVNACRDMEEPEVEIAAMRWLLVAARAYWKRTVLGEYYGSIDIASMFSEALKACEHIA